MTFMMKCYTACFNFCQVKTIQWLQVDFVGIFTELYRDAGVSASTEVAVILTNYFQLLDDLLADENEDKDR